MVKKKNNLDLFLHEIFKNFIAIKDADYRKAKEVFNEVFFKVKQKMGEKCKYFGKYSSQVMYAGSVYDGVKVSRMDEFDMDIVIRLPINYDKEIIIENEHPGFVKLKIGKAFDNLDNQQNWEDCHKVTRNWRDEEKYLLQNKFRQWMHSIVQKALNELNGQVTVNGVTYLVTFNESGPAYTLNIYSHDKGHDHFKLNVDLVPVIRFMYPRWPEGYRPVNESIVKDWLVVPKPDKYLWDEQLKNRCWRLSFQDFERDMMKGCQHLKTTLRLVKKLRDSLKMNAIASYYIKTLFLWKIVETKEKKYWQNRPSLLFRIMVEELYKAIKARRIKYFWNDENNLIRNLPDVCKIQYSFKLENFILSIDLNLIANVAKGLLAPEEFEVFEKSEFYQHQLASSGHSSVTSLSRSDSENSLADNPDSMMELVKALNQKLDALIDDNQKLKNALETKEEVSNIKEDKINELISKIDDQNERLRNLEIENRNYKERFFDISNAITRISAKAEAMGLDDENPKRLKRTQ